MPPVADDGFESECLVCTAGGDLVCCEFRGCSAVFHTVCIYEHQPVVDHAEWFCPRHTCATCGQLQPLDSGPADFWQCTACPLSFCAAHAPLSVSASLAQQRQRIAMARRARHTREAKADSAVPLRSCSRFTCSHCTGRSHASRAAAAIKCGAAAANSTASSTAAATAAAAAGASPLLEMARLLEACWARMAANHLALPFMGPLLPLIVDGGGRGSVASGAAPPVAPPAAAPAAPPVLPRMAPSLLELLERVRGLQFRSCHAFEDSLHQLIQCVEAECGDATATSARGGGEQERAGADEAGRVVCEAARTLAIIFREQAAPVADRLRDLERQIARCGDDAVCCADHAHALHVRWRQELSRTPWSSPAVRTAPRSLEQWQQYLEAAPVSRRISATVMVTGAPAATTAGQRPASSEPPCKVARCASSHERRARDAVQLSAQERAIVGNLARQHDHDEPGALLAHAASTPPLFQLQSDLLQSQLCLNRGLHGQVHQYVARSTSAHGADTLMSLSRTNKALRKQQRDQDLELAVLRDECRELRRKATHQRVGKRNL